MAKNLVIVESPAKAKTIKRYLGSDYQVMPSVGHVVDLPKSKLGVDVEHDFAPDYVVIKGKEKVIGEIKSAAKGKENIYLASDPDREGEAIAWHIAEHLGKTKSNVRRVLLHEITAAAVKQAVANPSNLDHHLFDAYQARRVLDRLVGYKLSPLLWDKVKRGISAGRVQSVALRIIVDREREREAFRAEEYWTLDARLSANNPPPFKARLFSYQDERIDNKSRKLPEAEARAIMAAVEAAPFKVKSVERKEVRRSPTPPFITSRLQQEASRKLYFQPRRTMQIAQKLYEGVELGEQGAVGLITYMRTDSPRVSDQALESVRNHIGSRYGKQYVPDKPNFYRSGKQAQGAHEAIRPTAVERDPESIARYLDKDALALYTLIYNRFVSSQMTPAVYDRTTVDIESADAIFRATGQVMKFDGFMRVYIEGQDEISGDDEEGSLPMLSEGETLKLLGLDPEQHFTQPPPRFTQATLIKELEEQGIGRPSTYAAIMTSILKVEYVEEDESKRMRPTSLGRVVNDMLVKAFPDILESGFTAQFEEDLDKVEEGAENWVKTLRRFYGPFAKDLAEAKQKMPEVKRKGLPTGLKCELDGGDMVIKWGRNGEFVACSNYPKCTNTGEIARDDQGIITLKAPSAPVPTDEVCEKCGKPMVKRRSRFGEFLGCSGYPECDGIKRLQSAPRRPESRVRNARKARSSSVAAAAERFSTDAAVIRNVSSQPGTKSSRSHAPLAAPHYMVEKNLKRTGVTWQCANKECGYKAPAPAVEQPAPAPASTPPA